MDGATRIVVTGASGRMGQQLIKLVEAEDSFTLVGALERPGHEWVGKDIGLAAGGRARSLCVSDEPDDTFPLADAIIDFTTPGLS